ncbi:MAG: AraC family transcriptional regulator [Paenibacillaceae bacterium]|nr:AraC family transcriptional regulator [Paenibacillaceae bacterium]
MNVRRTLTNSVDNLDDLIIWNAGAKRAARSGFGALIRDHYLIMHIMDGHGDLKIGDRAFHVRAGEGFIVPPETVHHYESTGAKPWAYFWFSFHGIKAEHFIKKAGLSYDQPVYTLEEKTGLFETLRDYVQQGWLHDSRPCSELTKMKVLALLYQYFAQLVEAAVLAEQSAGRKKDIQQEQYVKKAIQFIEMNFYKKISIADVAGYVGLNPSYLGQLFKQQIRLSPQLYVCQFRIDKAVQYMNNPAASIKEIARSVGYEDPYLFSRIFRQLKGMPPTQFRKKLTNEAVPLGAEPGRAEMDSDEPV